VCDFAKVGLETLSNLPFVLAYRLYLVHKTKY
jgi:hypothetical protein